MTEQVPTIKKVQKKSLAQKLVRKWTTRKEVDDLLDREAERQKLLEFLQRNKTELQARLGKRETAIRFLAITNVITLIIAIILGVI